MASFAIAVTRVGLSLIGRLAPQTAGRLAFRLFCRTPSRRHPNAKTQAAFAGGRAALAAARIVMIDTGSGAVASRVFEGRGHRRRKVLVVHGWGSRSEFLADLVTGIAASGADVVTLDLPGHGLSYGRSLNLRQAAEALSAVQVRFGRFDAAIGHSLGGAALMTAAGGIFPGIARLETDRLVLIGAPSHVAPVLDRFSRTLRLAPQVRAALLAEAERLTGCPLPAFDTLPIARALKRPMLVVHAEDDKEVNADSARRYEGVADEIRVLWANGYGHRRIVSAPQVIDAVADFVALPEAPVDDGDGSGRLRNLSSI